MCIIDSELAFFIFKEFIWLLLKQLVLEKF